MIYMDCSSIFISKGYRPVKTAEVLARANLSHSGALPKVIFYKVIPNPQMGRIGLYLSPYQVQPNPSVAPLVDQIEKILASSAEDLKPAVFSGQRSPIFANEPFSLRFKGLLVRPFESKTFSFPQEMRNYGHSSNLYDFDTDGCRLIRENFLSNGPYGAMLFKEAVAEWFNTNCLADEFIFVTPALGFGEFMDKPFVDPDLSPELQKKIGRFCRNPFVDWDEQKPTGFSIHPTEGTERVRTIGLLEAVADRITSPQERAKLLAELFSLIGLVVYSLHKAGFSLFNLHLEDFSFNPQEPLDLSNIRVHDLGRVRTLKNLGVKAYFGYVFQDLMGITQLMNIFAERILYPGLTPEDIEKIYSEGTMNEDEKTFARYQTWIWKTLLQFVKHDASLWLAHSAFLMTYFRDIATNIRSKYFRLDWEHPSLLLVAFAEAAVPLLSAEETIKLKDEWVATLSPSEQFKRVRQYAFAAPALSMDNFLSYYPNPLLYAKRNLMANLLRLNFRKWGFVE